MPIKQYKSRTPGRRGSSVIDYQGSGVDKVEPFAPLTSSLSKKGGRNTNGRITVRHRGGGHKRKYRIIDWKRNKDGSPAVVERLEYDPNRTANIALLKYKDGERRYIIAPKGVKAGDELMSLSLIHI